MGSLPGDSTGDTGDPYFYSDPTRSAYIV